jgi:hypothetical protein
MKVVNVSKKDWLHIRLFMLMHNYTHARTLETKGLKMGLKIKFLNFSIYSTSVKLNVNDFSYMCAWMGKIAQTM